MPQGKLLVGRSDAHSRITELLRQLDVLSQKLEGEVKPTVEGTPRDPHRILDVDERASLKRMWVPGWKALEEYRWKKRELGRAVFRELEAVFDEATATRFKAEFSDKDGTDAGSPIERYEFYQGELRAIREALTDIEARIDGCVSPTPATQPADPAALVERTLRRFHHVARQLRSRREDRPTLAIADEYDVQDLLHALFKLEFDDIRTEEWVPSYAGGAARMDFLLKQERIVIEAKKTRDSLRDRQVGDELLVDIQRYAQHQDCGRLYCFVYDPDGLLKNPAALENDLTSPDRHPFPVHVVVAPRLG
jgi:hypothetical protein